MECKLEYIPERLHSNDKPIVQTFLEGEELYYRCKEDECSRPYDKISLYDISHNRNFNDPENFQKSDVLFNIIEDDERELYDNFNTSVLRIQNLQGSPTYTKQIPSREDPELIVIIKLLHDPIPCMYPHSVFEVSINGVIVTRENYDSVLNLRNKKYKNIRSDIRQELTSIIQTGNIDPSQDIQYLDEP